MYTDTEHSIKIAEHFNKYFSDNTNNAINL